MRLKTHKYSIHYQELMSTEATLRVFFLSLFLHVLGFIHTNETETATNTATTFLEYAHIINTRLIVQVRMYKQCYWVGQQRFKDGFFHPLS